MKPLLENSVFDPTNARSQAALLQRLALMDVSDAWNTMSVIRDVEIRNWSAHEFARIAETAASAMRRAPHITASYDVPRIAESFAIWKLRRFLASTFHALLQSFAPHKVADAFRVRHAERIAEWVSQGVGVVAVPIYVEEYILGRAVLSTRYPTTQVVGPSLGVTSTSDAWPFPTVTSDTDFVATPHPSAMLQLRRSLQRGRVVVLVATSHDDSNRRDRTLMSVPFLGARTVASEAGVMLAAATGAPVVAIVARYRGGGRFEVTFHEPVFVEKSVESRRAALADLVALEEELVMANPGAWNGWSRFTDWTMTAQQLDEVDGRVLCP